jgi:hypothetical protein
MKAFWSCLAFLFAAFAIFLSPAIAQSTDSSQPSQPAAPPTTEPQLVRLSYVEGDVRFNRGDGNRPDLKKPWEQAGINLPIEQGFALSTGNDGRAEIEFETGGIVYLAENSVLLFDQLTSTGGVPATRLELVSGTLTTGVQPIQEEIFAIQMPGGQYAVKSPESAYMRVDSYLDGMAFTPQSNDGSYYYENGSTQRLLIQKGQTLVYQDGRPVQLEGAGQSKGPNGWDDWVSARYTARESAMQAALKASGFSTPIPGLTDLYASGTFSQCAPYGTCWEPSQQTTGAPHGQAAAQTLPPPAAQAAPFVPQPVDFETLEDGCPFPLWDSETVMAYTPEQYIDLSYQAYLLETQQPYFWPVCHFSSWIYRHNHYVVVIRRRRRHYPVRWVKVGKREGFVPAHPNDEKGKPPLNLKHGIFIVNPQGAPGRIEHVNFDPKEKLEILGSPPKEFRPGPVRARPSAAPPEIRGRLVEYALRGANSAAAKPHEAAINYDYGKGKFVQSGLEVGGRASKPVVVASLSSRGGFTHGQADASTGSGWQRNEGNRGSGGSSHAGGGSSASRSYSGGGSARANNGGGGGGMGGGSHSGGGGGGSSGGRSGESSHAK